MLNFPGPFKCTATWEFKPGALYVPYVELGAGGLATEMEFRVTEAINANLLELHQYQGAWLTSDPEAVINAHGREKGRWIVWAHGAGALLTRDWERTDPWLGACLEISENSETSDRLWLAEVTCSLGELSLRDGEYFDATLILVQNNRSYFQLNI